MPISRIFAIALALGCAVPVRAASPDVREKQVLVVHSTRRTSQLVTVSDREIPEILGSGVPESVDYYTEFVDEARFPVREYQLAFRDFLRSKYRDQRFDLLIAMGDNALEFVANTRADLFPATP
ncbi:MAG TPA: hypothetical protein VLV86_25150, partial [Vicinamibacterales bacterium]|nr:hypothetical protein [Vicinamibacterales bacterium]